MHPGLCFKLFNALKLLLTGGPRLDYQNDSIAKPHLADLKALLHSEMSNIRRYSFYRCITVKGFVTNIPLRLQIFKSETLNSTIDELSMRECKDSHKTKCVLSFVGTAWRP